MAVRLRSPQVQIEFYPPVETRAFKSDLSLKSKNPVRMAHAANA